MTETELRAVVPEETSLGFGAFSYWVLCDHGNYVSYSWDATLEAA
jgi:hypothetical protein